MRGAVVGERLPPPPCHLVPVLSQLQAGSFFILLPEREFPVLNERPDRAQGRWERGGHRGSSGTPLSSLHGAGLENRMLEESLGLHHASGQVNS